MIGQVAKTDLINACPMLIHSINSPLTSSHLIQTETTKSNMYILDTAKVSKNGTQALN